MALCKHCSWRPASGSDGLCKNCSGSPSIVELARKPDDTDEIEIPIMPGGQNNTPDVDADGWSMSPSNPDSMNDSHHVIDWPIKPFIGKSFEFESKPARADDDCTEALVREDDERTLVAFGCRSKQSIVMGRTPVESSAESKPNDGTSDQILLRIVRNRLIDDPETMQCLRSSFQREFYAAIGCAPGSADDIDLKRHKVSRVITPRYCYDEIRIRLQEVNPCRGMLLDLVHGVRNEKFDFIVEADLFIERKAWELNMFAYASLVCPLEGT